MVYFCFFMMQYFIITSPDQVIGEIEIINTLLTESNATLHLRKPNFSKLEMAKYLKKTNPYFHHRIVIHSHHALVKHFNLKGIHFTQHNKHLINNFANYTGTKSISTHSYKEIQTLKQTFNYYFLSPIFQSVSKPQYGGNNYKLEELKAFIKCEPHKNIVALGGITKSNIAQVKDIGFYGAALLGTFWQYFTTSNHKQLVKSFFSELISETLSN